MNNNNLSNETMKKIDKLVERVAKKAGYTGKDNMNYKQIIQEKYKRYYKGCNKKDTDFAEEVKTYLKDGLMDLINEGYSEEEALRITMEKFDEAEVNESFDDFAQYFANFGIKQIEENSLWYMQHGEEIGLFYATFVIFGLSIGFLIGYFIGHTLVNIIISILAGLFIGVAFGLLSNAIIVSKRRNNKE